MFDLGDGGEEREGVGRWCRGDQSKTLHALKYTVYSLIQKSLRSTQRWLTVRRMDTVEQTVWLANKQTYLHWYIFPLQVKALSINT